MRPAISCGPRCKGDCGSSEPRLENCSSWTSPKRPRHPCVALEIDVWVMVKGRRKEKRALKRAFAQAALEPLMESRQEQQLVRSTSETCVLRKRPLRVRALGIWGWESHPNRSNRFS